MNGNAISLRPGFYFKGARLLVAAKILNWVFSSSSANIFSECNFSLFALVVVVVVVVFVVFGGVNETKTELGFE